MSNHIKEKFVVPLLNCQSAGALHRRVRKNREIKNLSNTAERQGK